MTNVSTKFFDWLFRSFRFSFLIEVSTAIIKLRTANSDA